MATFRQAATWWPVSRIGFSIDQTLAKLYDIGYQGVEFVPREHFSLVRDSGLSISAMPGHQSLSDGLNKRENHDRIERELTENIALASQWNIPVLICFSGNRDGLADEAGAEITADGLSRVAKAAEDAGVTLAIELLNSRVNHPGYQADRTAWGVDVCGRVGSPAVKLLYDIYHMQIMEGDLIRTIQDFHSFFAHYHTAGNPGRNEIGESQEIYYPAVCRAIDATGFTGFVAHEFGPKGDALEALTEAFRVCDV